MRNKPTMTDIAKAAGVSQTCVSFILSGKNDMRISDETKRKVIVAAEKLGYFEKLPKLGKTGNIGVAFDVKISGNAFMNIIGGVGEVLEEHGYLPLLVGGPLNADNIEACKKIAAEKRADGIILFEKNKKICDSFEKAKFPYMSVEIEDGFEEWDDESFFEFGKNAADAVTELLSNLYYADCESLRKQPKDAADFAGNEKKAAETSEEETEEKEKKEVTEEIDETEENIESVKKEFSRDGSSIWLL